MDSDVFYFDSLRRNGMFLYLCYNFTCMHGSLTVMAVCAEDI